MPFLTALTTHTGPHWHGQPARSCNTTSPALPTAADDDARPSDSAWAADIPCAISECRVSKALDFEMPHIAWYHKRCLLEALQAEQSLASQCQPLLTLQLSQTYRRQALCSTSSCAVIYRYYPPGLPMGGSHYSAQLPHPTQHQHPLQHQHHQQHQHPHQHQHQAPSQPPQSHPASAPTQPQGQASNQAYRNPQVQTLLHCQLWANLLHLALPIRATALRLCHTALQLLPAQ